MPDVEGWSACFDCVTLPPLSLLAQLLLLSLVSGLSFSLPFLLTPSDVFSRRSVLALESALSLAGGLLLSSSLLWALASALALSAAASVPASLCLLMFGCGLLTPPAIERSLLVVFGAWVRRRRLAAAEAEAEAALSGSSEQAAVEEEAARHNGHRKGLQKDGAVHNADGGTDGSEASAAAASSSSARSGRGRRSDAPSPLLPPPVRDYRKFGSRPLEEVSDDELNIDLDDIDQLSPPLFPSAPLLGHSQLSASYCSYPTAELDAATFINERRFIARCLFCKESVATRKGLAYHAAGCQLKPLPAFTVHSSSLTALRGRRQPTLDDSRIPAWVLAAIGLTEHAAVGVVAGAAASVSLQSSTLPSQLTAALALAAYCFLSALGVGLLLRQCRVSAAAMYLGGLLVTAPLPLATLLLSVWRGWLTAPLLVCAYGWLAGLLCWHAVVDCLLEEMERREARVKWLLFASAFACIAALNAT